MSVIIHTSRHPWGQALWPADLIQDAVRQDHQIVIFGRSDTARLESGNSILLLEAIVDAAQIIVDLELLFTALCKDGEVSTCLCPFNNITTIEAFVFHDIICCGNAIRLHLMSDECFNGIKD